MDDFALALPSEASEIRDVDGVAAALVVQVAEQGIEHPRPRIVFGGVIELRGNGEIERGIAGIIPAGRARPLGFFRKTGAVGAGLSAAKLVLARGRDFSFTTFQEERVLFVAFDFSRFSREGVTAN